MPIGVYKRTTCSHRRGLTLEQEYGNLRAGEIRKKLSISHIGKNSGERLPRKIRNCLYCNKPFKVAKPSSKKRYCSRSCGSKSHSKQRIERTTCKTCGKIFQYATTGKRHRKYCSLKCSGIASKERILENWKNPVFAKKCLVYNDQRPNKAELDVDNFLKAEFPNKFEFTGDGKISIGGKIPDWVGRNGHKIIIELYGNHWHTEEDVVKRIKFFSKYGYKTLIIWSSEFYHNKIKIKKDIEELLK